MSWLCSLNTFDLYPKCSESTYGILVYLRSLGEPVDHIQRDMWHVNMHVLYGAFVFFGIPGKYLRSHNQNHQTCVFLVMFGSYIIRCNIQRTEKNKKKVQETKYPFHGVRPFEVYQGGFPGGKPSQSVTRKPGVFCCGKHVLQPT